MRSRATAKAYDGAFGAEAQLRRIADLLETLVAPKALSGETVDVKGMAKLLHCSERAVYVKHQRGQLPKPLPGRRLIWRKADVLVPRE